MTLSDFLMILRDRRLRIEQKGEPLITPRSLDMALELLEEACGLPGRRGTSMRRVLSGLAEITGCDLDMAYQELPGIDPMGFAPLIYVVQELIRGKCDVRLLRERLLF